MQRPLVMVDEGLPVAAALLAPVAQVRGFAGRGLGPESPGLAEARGLVVRSISRITGELLRAAPALRVVASATIGLDHVDRAAARERGVAVYGAPGGNAPGVADWALWALVCDAAERGLPLVGRRLAVAGVGHTGGALAARAAALGMEVWPHDPPRAQREAGFVTWPRGRLFEADILSLHMPLVEPGASPWPTRDWLGEGDLESLPASALVLNAARGELAPEGLGPRRAAVDTWRGEPRPCPESVAAVWRATPHVAGATVEGRRRCQLRAARAVARALGLRLPPPPPSTSPTLRADLFAPALADAEREAVGAAAIVLEAATGFSALEAVFRAASRRGESFDTLRDGHCRHELGALALSVEGHPSARTRQVLAALGLRAAPPEAAHLRLRVE